MDPPVAGSFVRIDNVNGLVGLNPRALVCFQFEQMLLKQSMSTEKEERAGKLAHLPGKELLEENDLSAWIDGGFAGSDRCDEKVAGREPGIGIVV